jgi:hypothetical protein
MRISATSIGKGRERRVRSNSSRKPRGREVPPASTIGSGRSVFGSFSAREIALRRVSTSDSTRSS